MKLLVTGAGGFLGSAVVRAAVAAGHGVRALYHRSSAGGEAGETLTGDLTDSGLWERAVAGIEGVIHCAGITPTGRVDARRSQAVNVEATAGLYAAAGRAGVARWVQISSMSAHAGSSSVYGRTKFAADQALRAGPGVPAWVILRPSLIYGPGAKGLLGETLQRLRALPFIPIVGEGKTPLRPIHVDDVAQAALCALSAPEATGRSLMLGGADEVTLDRFFLELCEIAGLRRQLIHLPLRLALPLARILEKLLSHPPLNVDNVLGIQEAQRVEIEEAVKVFGLKPRSLSVGLREALAE